MIYYLLFGVLTGMFTDWVLSKGEDEYRLNWMERILIFGLWPIAIIYYIYTLIRLLLDEKNK